MPRKKKDAPKLAEDDVPADDDVTEPSSARRRGKKKSKKNQVTQHLNGDAGGGTHPEWTPERSNLKKRDKKEALPFNRQFAECYEASKRKQLLANVPAALLEASSESSSSEEEEDEFGELLTKRIDRRVQEALEAIRNKDPRIYDPTTKFFQDAVPEGGQVGAADDAGEDDRSSEESYADSEDEPVAGWDTIAKAADSEAPKMTLKDYVRETLLKDGKLSDSDDEQEYDQEYRVECEKDRPNPIGEFQGRETKQSSTTADGEGRKAKNSLWDEELGRGEQSGEESDSGGGSEDGDFFTKKAKSKDELEAEEKDFDSFLKKQSRKVSQKAGEELLLHSYLENEKPDEKERFLRDFVLNNGWLDKNAEEAPAAGDYEIEVDNVNPDAEEEGSDRGMDEDEFDDEADRFEAEYNFRFEDPDGAQVISHARKVSDSMRRPDDRRKRAREARRLRKEQEKASKTEDIKRLKNLKKQEIQARLFAIQDAAGDGLDVNGIDLDGDFNADDFNRQMEKKFGDEYYAQNDEDMAELTKEGVAVATEKRLHSKKSEDAPEEVREELDKMMDEYYNLDYEDIVAGVPMRFNYKKVDSESFNLTTEDILAMEDKELNRLVSLKKIAPYRANRDVKKDAWRVRNALKQKRQGSRSERDGDNSVGQTVQQTDLGYRNDRDSTKEATYPGAKKLEKRKKKSARTPAVTSDLGALAADEAEEAIALQADISQRTTSDKQGEANKEEKTPKKRKRRRSRQHHVGNGSGVHNDVNVTHGEGAPAASETNANGQNDEGSGERNEDDASKNKKRKKRKRPSKHEVVDGLSSARKAAYCIQ